MDKQKETQRREELKKQFEELGIRFDKNNPANKKRLPFEHIPNTQDKPQKIKFDNRTNPSINHA